jgi:hypothetical protein
MLMCFSLHVPRWFYIAKYTTYGFCTNGTYKYETATLAYELDCQAPPYYNSTQPDGGWFYSVNFSSGIGGDLVKTVDHAGPVEPGIWIIVSTKSERSAFTQMQLCWHFDRADRGCAFPGGGLSVGYGR